MRSNALLTPNGRRRHRSIGLRTTLNMDDGILKKVKACANDRSLGLGKAVSQLVRRGLAAQSATRTLNGLQVFDLPEDSPIVSAEDVRRLEDQEA